MARKARTAAPQRQGSLAIATGTSRRPLKTSESVARDIVRHIVTAGLEPGDNLPHETAMLAEYGVSRESLREGLRLLEVQGLITIRRGPGGGPVVGAVDPAHLGRVSTLYYHLAGATYRELFEAWVTAEVYIADLAARNPDRELVRTTMARFRGHHPAVDEPLMQFVDDHSSFHEALGTLARNKVMQLSLMAIGQIVTHHILSHADPRAAGTIIESGHEAIAAAVAAGHASKARTLMERHVREIVSFYEAEIGPQDDYIEWR
ncbi:FadR/GntR family transcriptional regulator [Desertimonas flava]|uniref:FadR/GntR family transcriptional regulator n=1 Tax=Desertimonas flava TaxID=2064846 RepID=UPI000E346C4E|nr:GntR family transcriptional regulator [Desertimonas flava]